MAPLPVPPAPPSAYAKFGAAKSAIEAISAARNTVIPRRPADRVFAFTNNISEFPCPNKNPALQRDGNFNQGSKDRQRRAHERAIMDKADLSILSCARKVMPGDSPISP
jgi:hypothetical protein